MHTRVPEHRRTQVISPVTAPLTPACKPPLAVLGPERALSVMRKEKSESLMRLKGGLGGEQTTDVLQMLTFQLKKLQVCACVDVHLYVYVTTIS